jgi:hypothetical protein
MKVSLLSIVAGVLLILPLAFVIEQEMFVLRRSDVMSGLKPLTAIPLENVRNTSSVSRDLVIPSDGWWKRMTRFYGSPKFLITTVNVPLGAAGYRRLVYPREDVGIRVKVLRGGSEVPLEPTDGAPYGYSSETSNSGWLFQAGTGERLRLVVESSEISRPLPGEIVVVPDWPRGGIPNALAGFAFGYVVLWFLVAGAGVGVVLITFGSRRRRRTSE